MQTDYTIYRPGGTSETRSVDWPEDPGYFRIRDLVKPLLNGGDLDHISVLHDGKRLDMFVDDMGITKKMRRNAAATAIYRNAALTKDPDRSPETLPRVVGVAVLFSRRIWF